MLAPNFPDIVWRGLSCHSRFPTFLNPRAHSNKQESTIYFLKANLYLDIDNITCNTHKLQLQITKSFRKFSIHKNITLYFLISEYFFENKMQIHKLFFNLINL